MAPDSLLTQPAFQQLAFSDVVDMMDEAVAAPQRDLTNDTPMMDVHISQITDDTTLTRKQWKKRKQHTARKNSSISKIADSFLQ